LRRLTGPCGFDGILRFDVLAGLAGDAAILARGVFGR
jgi:hypothetical protein